MQENQSLPTRSWLAVCSKGIEPLLADEIRALGGEVERETHLGVHWQGTLETAYRVCLWSRLANRLLMPMLEEDTDSVEAMYDHVRNIDWTMVFPSTATFRIDFHGRSPFINNTQFGAQKIKDAIVDCFREEAGSRPNVDKNADIRVEAQLRKGKLAIYLNFSGSGMHRRGYRLQPGLAPLKETLAAALLVRAGWPEMAKAGKHLVDPMCGSGTLLIEAGLMAADVAPGLNRQEHGFERWHGHNRKLWLELVEEARERRADGINSMKNRFYGFDKDAKQLDAASANLARSGLAGLIHLEKREVEQLRISKDAIEQGGLLITNPPYGERLSELPQLAPLYQQLHDAAMRVPEWKLAVFTGNTDLAKAIRRPFAKRYKFLNGKIETQLLMFDAADERSSQPQASMIRGPVEAFANRLKKNLKQIDKWAKREEIFSYRVYDQDLPEYAVAVDVYTDARDPLSGRWLHVQEYVPPKSIDEAKAERRLLDVLAVLPEVTGVSADQIVLKRRERQAGKKQYEKQSTDGVARHRFPTREGQAQVWVNLKDYLDTGLFLDHRPTRLDIAKRIAKLPAPKFLNLFCYTATASVHAAKAGAMCTSVDMSRTYLNWGKDNFELNGIKAGKHEFIQADCLQWLADCSGKYDLIFMDPPTFSNSKRMEGVLDIQRDHVRLIEQAMACLNPGGLLIFSTNLRKFAMDSDALQAGAAGPLKIQNVSKKSVPQDYARRPNIHHCFHIERA